RISDILQAKSNRTCSADGVSEQSSPFTNPMEGDHMSGFSLAAVIGATMLAVTSIGTASAETNFPAKPVKIVLPLPPGSALDVVTRMVGEKLAGRWGQQVVVENRPGAGGAIAAQAVASAQPDGYTLLGGAGSIFQILPAQRDKIAIDVNRDFVQIGMVTGRNPLYVAVPPRLGITTFPQFVAMAKS